MSKLTLRRPEHTYLCRDRTPDIRILAFEDSKRNTQGEAPQARLDVRPSHHI